MYSDRKSVSNRDMYNNGNSSGYGRQGYGNYRAGNGSNQDMRSTYQQDFNQYQQAPPRSPHYQHHQDYRSPSRTHSEPRIAYGNQGYNRGYGGNGASGNGGYNSGYRQQQTPTKSSGYGYNRNSSRNARDQPKQVSKFDLESKATVGRAEEDKKKRVLSTVYKCVQLPLKNTVQNKESTDKAKTVESSRTNVVQSIPVTDFKKSDIIQQAIEVQQIVESPTEQAIEVQQVVELPTPYEIIKPEAEKCSGKDDSAESVVNEIVLPEVPVKSIPVIVIVPAEETPVEKPVSEPFPSEEEILPEVLVISSEVEVVCELSPSETSITETELEQCVVPSEQIPILEKTSNPDIVPEEFSNQEPVPKETPNPEPVPEASSNQEPILEDTSNPETVPEAFFNPELVPETSANSETVPEASSKPETVPEASFKPETVPETSAKPETVPEVSANPEPVPEASSIQEPVVPEASSKLESVPEVSSKLESVPEASSKLESVTEVSSKLESVPEASSELEPLPEASCSQEPIPVFNKEESEQIVEVPSNEPLPMQDDTTVLKKELSPKENEEAPKMKQVEDISDKLDNMCITPSKSSRKSKILLDSTNIIESSSITFVEVRKKDDPSGVQLTPVRRSTRKKANPQKISEETLSKAKLVPNPFFK